VDVEENETWESLKIHAVPLLQYIGQSTRGMQKICEEFEVKNKCIAIPTQVRCLANPHTMKMRRQNAEIPTSSVVFVVRGSRLAQKSIKNGIKAA